jgi:thiol-disulfide isomerase/thioredoxin
MKQLLLLLCLLLIQCGGPKTRVQQTSGKVNLILFSAAWCEPCHIQIPRYQQIINSLEAAKRDRIQVTVFVGESQRGVAATLETAASEKNKLGVDFNVTIDPWRWVNYKTFYKKLGAIPAAVISPEGIPFDAIEPGSAGPEEVMQKVLDYIK